MSSNVIISARAVSLNFNDGVLNSLDHKVISCGEYPTKGNKSKRISRVDNTGYDEPIV